MSRKSCVFSVREFSLLRTYHASFIYYHLRIIIVFTYDNVHKYDKLSKREKSDKLMLHMWAYDIVDMS